MNKYRNTHSAKAAEINKSTAAAASAYNPLAHFHQTIGNRAVAQLVASMTGAAPQPVSRKADNRTGMPDSLKTGLEELSGVDLSDVRVHYNSDKPAQLEANAYAQGSDIHIAPGQERHLPHEGWHVVQQKMGKVQPTLMMETGVPVNNEAGLEREADIMGEKAVQLGIDTRHDGPDESVHTT